MIKETSFVKVMALFSLIFFYCSEMQSLAQVPAAKQDLRIRTIPYSLRVVNDPLNIEIRESSEIRITSKGKTNLFNNPGNSYYVQNAPMVLFHPDSCFMLKAKVRADLKEVYDVAALVIYENRDLWAKLCFENSIDKKATVVSVVTRRYSDDCNSVNVADDFVYLSIVKKGKEFSFYCSNDNLTWELIRHFRLECNDNDLMIGFAAHCSVGERFSAEFSDIDYSNYALENMRKYK